MLAYEKEFSTNNLRKNFISGNGYIFKKKVLLGLA